MENKIIGGISIETWKKAYADLIRLAIDNDYFTDYLLEELYDVDAETAHLDTEQKEAIIDDKYQEKWNFAHKAFEEIFDEKYYKWD